VLDSALSSPSGRGVIVDSDGALLGTVSASDVLARIKPRDASVNPAPPALLDAEVTR